MKEDTVIIARTFSDTVGSIYAHIYTQWKGSKAETSNFLAALLSLFDDHPSISLTDALKFWGESYTLDSAYDQMLVEIDLAQLRMYFHTGKVDGVKDSEALEAAYDEILKKGYDAFCRLPQKPDTDPTRMKDLYDDMQAAMLYIWDQTLIRDENEREAAILAFEKHFPNLETMYLMHFLTANDRNVYEDTVESALSHLQKLHWDEQMLNDRAAYYLDHKNTDKLAYVASDYADCFREHRTIANWTKAAAILANAFEMIDEGAGGTTMRVEQLLDHEKKAFKNVSFRYGYALTELVRHRPNMKWTDERSTVMYTLFFRGMILPDDALPMDHLWWNTELQYWILELITRKTVISEKIQGNISSALLLAGLKLRNNKERDSYRKLLDFTRDAKILKNSHYQRELETMYCDLDTSIVKEDPRFSIPFRTSVSTIGENAASLAVLLNELAAAPALENVLQTEYPYLYKELSDLRKNSHHISKTIMTRNSSPKSDSAQKPFVRSRKKLGRNDPCPCGSGKKFKNCCMGKGIYD